MSDLTFGEVKLASEQPGRRNLSEVVFRELLGGCCRVGTITVSPYVIEPVRLGDHYHPGTESFVVRAGSVTLYTAPSTDESDITVTVLSAGQTVEIPAGTVHTFLCARGAELLSIAHHEFDDNWIVDVPALNIPA